MKSEIDTRPVTGGGIAPTPGDMFVHAEKISSDFSDEAVAKRLRRLTATTQAKEATAKGQEEA